MSLLLVLASAAPPHRADTRLAPSIGSSAVLSQPTDAPHEWAHLLGGGHGCGAMGVAPWCGANANYTSHVDFRLGYYLGAWAAAASGSINVSGMSTEARIDRPFLYKSCTRSSCGGVPQKDACVH